MSVLINVSVLLLTIVVNILFYLLLSLFVLISLSYENIHFFFQNTSNDTTVMVNITITKKPRYFGIVARLFKSNPCKPNTPIKSERGNTMAEKIVNTRIVSFICKDILLANSSLVEFIVS